MALAQDESNRRVEAALREVLNVGSPRKGHPICSLPVKLNGWRWPVFWQCSPMHYFR
jgi:hypothetical protein